MSESDPSKQEFVQVAKTLGFGEAIMKAASLILYSHIFREFRTHAKIVLSQAVERLLPSEALFSVMSREKRLVAVKVDIQGFEHSIFDPDQLAYQALLSLQSLQAPNQPTRVYIDQNSKTFDLRVPTSELTAAIENENGDFHYIRIDSDQQIHEANPQEINPRQIQVVVRSNKIDGLTSRQILHRFSGAYFFIANAENGLQIEFDHLVGDGCVISSVLRPLLINVPIVAQKDTHTQKSDRSLNILPLSNDTVSSAKPKVILQAIAQVSSDLHGNDSLVLITSTRRNADDDRKHSPEYLNRVIPIPITAQELQTDYEQARATFAHPHQLMEETSLGKFLQAIRFTDLPRGILSATYGMLYFMPSFTVPTMSALTAFWPKIPVNQEEFAHCINRDIGSRVTGIYAAINMYSDTWGPIILARPSMYLPGRDTPISSFALSGKTKEKMERFASALQQHLDIRKQHTP
jgi:hypothetical protein